MPHDTTGQYDETPNHMIIWLDLGIAETDKYQDLKKAFATSTDPKNESPVKLGPNDYPKILDTETPSTVIFDGIWFLLAAFTNVERCVECFRRYQEKRIFFIVSGSMGEAALRLILPRFKHVFTDQVTDEPYASIYVFCHNIQYQMHWALDYREYIQIFNFDADLLSRMTRDIGDYFVTQAKYLLDEDPPNNTSAYHRLTWARKLYERYKEMENVSMRKELDEIKELLEEVEEDLKSSSDEDE